MPISCTQYFSYTNFFGALFCSIGSQTKNTHYGNDDRKYRKHFCKRGYTTFHNVHSVELIIYKPMIEPCARKGNFPFLFNGCNLFLEFSDGQFYIGDLINKMKMRIQ